MKGPSYLLSEVGNETVARVAKVVNINLKKGSGHNDSRCVKMFHVKRAIFFLRLPLSSATLMHMKKLTVFLVVLILLTGCATIFGIDTSKLQVGMTSQQVIDMIGQPTTVNKTTTESGTNEQWIYQPAMQSEFSKKTVYIYLENGKVKGWQS